MKCRNKISGISFLLQTAVRRMVATLSVLIFAHVSAVAATISANSDASSFVAITIKGIIRSGDAVKIKDLALSLKPKGHWDLNWLHVDLNSKGGSVDEALKIGRFLRKNNAYVTVYPDQECMSSCVFVFMSGASRNAGSDDGSNIGVHRPYLRTADVNQDFEKLYRETRGKLEDFFKDMRISIALLDLMYSIPPGDMKFLTDDEVLRYIPYRDPVYDEMRITSAAKEFGITNLQYRKRGGRASECYDLAFQKGYGDVENCQKAIYWGVDLSDYLARKVLAPKICVDQKLRATFAIPTGLSKSDCRKYVMRNGV